MKATQTKLWKGNAFVADPWRHAETDDGDGHIILPLSAFLDLPEETRVAASNRLGVLLTPGEKLVALLPHLERLPLIALSFPPYNDGRSHSKAALLKCRHHFKGEIRAVGDVLVDQIPLLLRNGFDTLEVTNPVAQKRLDNHISTAVGVFTQPATGIESQASGYSWRRIPRSAT